MLKKTLHTAAAALAITTSPRQNAGRSRQSWAARYRVWYDRIYDYLDKRFTELAIFNPFWRRFFSFFWMPFAFQSGLRLVHRKGDTLSILLPYRRPNRNWYGDMAGAALLGNAELAAGMILFEKCGADCIIVCRRMKFEFHANCTGPAIYVARAKTDIEDKLAAGRPFECAMEMDLFQAEKGSSEPSRKRVGSCEMSFSVTQKRYLPRRKRPWIPI
jgi:hypothetical protein